MKARSRFLPAACVALLIGACAGGGDEEISDAGTMGEPDASGAKDGPSGTDGEPVTDSTMPQDEASSGDSGDVEGGDDGGSADDSGGSDDSGTMKKDSGGGGKTPECPMTSKYIDEAIKAVATGSYQTCGGGCPGGDCCVKDGPIQVCVKK